MKGIPEVVAGFQTAVNALHSLGTEYHLCKRIFKHKDLSSPAHRLKDFGEDYEGAVDGLIKQILFQEGRPAIVTEPVTDNYASCGDMLQQLLTGEVRLRTLLNDLFVKFLELKDADASHDMKDIVHVTEKHMMWLEKQLDNIADLGETNYRTAKIV